MMTELILIAIVASGGPDGGVHTSIHSIELQDEALCNDYAREMRVQDADIWSSNIGGGVYRLITKCVTKGSHD